MGKPYVGDIPFDPKTGSLLRDNDYNRVCRPNYTFKAAMRVVDWQPTNASATVKIEDASYPPGLGPHYWMFMSEFFRLVTEVSLRRGETPPLEWTFHKRGAKFGIKAVLP